MNPYSVSPYSKYSVVFQDDHDSACTVTVSGVEALCPESAVKQARQIFGRIGRFSVVSVSIAVA